MKSRSKPANRLSAASLRCLRTLLELELDGSPIEFVSWRAKNATKIAAVEELKRHRMLEGETHAAVTLWGLLNTPGKRAKLTLTQVRRVFTILREFYPDHPKDSLTLDDLASRAGLPAPQARQAAEFLNRSPAFLSVHAQRDMVRITPNENYVALKGFDELKERTRKQYGRPIVALALTGTGHAIERELLASLENAESETVREAWQKVRERWSHDPAGTVTGARSLLEAGCRYVIEEFDGSVEGAPELPRLYKQAAAHLRLDSRPGIDESLRRLLGACSTIVDGVAHLRNELSDAHGKDRRSPKPAKRHAEFVGLLAAAATGLLLSTLDAQRPL